MPFFLVSIASNSHATIKHLKEWPSCQQDGNKVCPHAGFFVKNDPDSLFRHSVQWNLICQSFGYLLRNASLFVTGSSYLAFTTHVIFRLTPVGLFATSLHLLVQDGTSRRFTSFAIVRIVDLLISACPSLVKPCYQFHKVERLKWGKTSLLINTSSFYHWIWFLHRLSWTQEPYLFRMERYSTCA